MKKDKKDKKDSYTDADTKVVRMVEQDARLKKYKEEEARLPKEAKEAAHKEFDRRVADGAPYSVQTLKEADFSAKQPYKIDNMREDARKSTSDILRRPIGKKGGGAIKMASGGSVSKRADGCAVRGKTKGRMI